MPHDTSLSALLKRLKENPWACAGLIKDSRLIGVVHAHSILKTMDENSGRVMATPKECACSELAFTDADTPLTSFMQKYSNKDFEHIVVCKPNGQMQIISQDSHQKIQNFQETPLGTILPTAAPSLALEESETCLKALEGLSVETMPYLVTTSEGHPTGIVSRKDIASAIQTQKNIWQVSIKEVADYRYPVIADDTPIGQTLCTLESAKDPLFICQNSPTNQCWVVETAHLNKHIAHALNPLFAEFSHIAQRTTTQGLLHARLLDRTVNEAMNVGVIAISPQLVIQYCNKVAGKLLDLTDDIVGKKLSELGANGIKAFNSVEPVLKALDKDVSPVVNLDLPNTYSPSLQAKVTGIWENRIVNGYILTIEDTTDVKIAETKLRKLAYYDPLTGLPNRALLFERLSMEVKKSRREQSKFAVVFVDLDRFKEVNDKHGHKVGDALLSEVASRFSSAVRDSDTVARLGGDEFLFILPNMESKQTLAIVIYKVLRSICAPFEINGLSLSIGASFGSAYYPEDGTTPEDLIEHADKNMYKSKKNTTTC
ncbi:sensor domain-containing diguanylate cyclase [Pseudodesulfovibrio sp. zrk46]|uniref:diguanylate cyclase domain-containing protein n=1 Tax=Pseudodesulfovibrio sp. zrk46 TaxID=2725288 RepID=UPI001449EBBF|nr:sensor domain-containing diguanylate cyclase [Pseudodesulfovibrio sp. zrk46]QJB55332.1 sensor domain-containing diguanylate cyclase [Pseudodesulfovibrio sp. zrk46]